MTEQDRPHPTLGDIIRQQRELAALPLRQLASMVGISNPYLSQIERGLRAPSEQVLESIARSLHTSADALQEQAAVFAADDPPTPAVVTAIRDDPSLTSRQRQALIEAYTAMAEVTVARRHRRGRSSPDDGAGGDAGDSHRKTDSGKPGTEDGPGLPGSSAAGPED